MEIQALYQQAISFAAAKHRDQKVPGSGLPYVVHLSNVAMEILIAAAHTPHFNLPLAIQAALLHDTIEDTDTTFEELVRHFGAPVAEAVLALTKNSELPKELQMGDSLSRIIKMPKEIWAVKMADRITNLQAPPSHWIDEKKISYQAEAQNMWENLQEGNIFLAKRLEGLIKAYSQYL
jgi:guanosine-3',5'-bis(diphosphate) 3'-pyrophosphohydrolase